MKIAELIDRLPAAEREKILMMAAQYQEAVTREKCQTNFLAFVKEMWPGFIPGRHHAVVAKKFEEIAEGKLKRLIICMPPRHTKSQMGSYLFPAWYLGKYPDRKIIQTSNTAELAVGFGRSVRNLIDSERYQSVFPNVSLRQDSKAAGRWATNHNGDYFAIGVGGTVTGKGADCAYFSCKALTARGLIPLSEVKVGDKVYGYDHKSGKPRWSAVRAVSTQIKPVLVNVGGFLCTPDHRIFTSDGYEQAWKIRDFAVSNLPEGVLEAAQRALAGDTSAWRVEGYGQNVLFGGMQQIYQKPESLRLREQESSSCGSVQTVLLERQACAANMHDMQERISTKHLRAPAEHSEAWGNWPGVLLQGLLRNTQSNKAAAAFAGDWEVPNLRKWSSEQPEVLFNGLLRQEGGQGNGVHGKLVHAKAPSQETGQWGMRFVRTDQAACGGASYRPQRYEQQPDQSGDAVRAVSWPISSTDSGACAKDYSGLLCGDGFWVVDIQTETENFFAASPECDSVEEFLRTAVLAHNCLIIDDPHSEQEAALAATNPDVFDKVYEWYSSGPRQRLQPGGAIVIIMTRWSKRDLVSQVLKAEAQRGGESWEIIEFPAIMPSGKPLWPEFWPLNELEALKAELPNAKWQAQYQQSPTSEAAAIVKREWWKRWEKDSPPHCEFVLQAWDTAFEATRRADYSACTTWGVFTAPDDTGLDQANLILLDAVRDRMEFPVLKKKVLEMYQEHAPDCLIVEKKASGAPLIYELRRMGVSVEEYTPVRGAANNPNTKVTRLNAVSDIFASGRVWAPNTQWAEEVIDEVASFPNSEHDDFTDTVSLALMRFRRGGFITTRLDEEDEQPEFRRKFEGYY